MPSYVHAPAKPHFPTETRHPCLVRTGLARGPTLTLCRLEREADFRGGVFFGLNVFPKRGIFGLTRHRQRSGRHTSGVTDSWVRDWMSLS